MTKKIDQCALYVEACIGEFGTQEIETFTKYFPYAFHKGISIFQPGIGYDSRQNSSWFSLNHQALELQFCSKQLVRGLARRTYSTNLKNITLCNFIGSTILLARLVSLTINPIVLDYSAVLQPLKLYEKILTCTNITTFKAGSLERAEQVFLLYMLQKSDNLQHLTATHVVYYDSIWNALFAYAIKRPTLKLGSKFLDGRWDTTLYSAAQVYTILERIKGKKNGT